ncbi:MAG: phosphoglycerate kinase [Cyanobacteria bacterium P01_H01_bin.74]
MTATIFKKQFTNITEINWQGKTALVREDLNVPQDEAGKITDDTRIKAALPTIKYLLAQGANVVLVSHLGRPKGKVISELSLKPVADRLAELLQGSEVQQSDAKNPVQFISETTLDAAKNAVNQLPSGYLAVLENIRFYSEEEQNDAAFAEKLAQFADYFVNDAFGTSHRAHGSTTGIAKHLPAVAGFLMEKEINSLSMVLNSDAPITAIIGGSKVSTKITVLENLMPRVKNIIIGGGMIFTFLKAQGFSVGSSLLEDDYVDLAKSLLERSGLSGMATIHLPKDIVVADRFSADAKYKTVMADEISEGWMGLDVGPATMVAVNTLISDSTIVLWNGPLGVFEIPQFSAGTRLLAESVAKLTQEPGTQFQSILGGGDTVAAIEQFSIPFNSFTHVSTGGGACLEFLEGKTLPGIAALMENPAKN